MTVTTQVSLQLPSFAVVMMAVPAATAVIRPVADTSSFGGITGAVAHFTQACVGRGISHSLRLGSAHSFAGGGGSNTDTGQRDLGDLDCLHVLLANLVQSITNVLMPQNMVATPTRTSSGSG